MIVRVPGNARHNGTERFDRTRLAAALARSLAAAREVALMLAMAGGVCLSWPQVGRSMMLATRIIVYYCFSPR